MNACEKILLYASHELSPQEETVMKNHIQGCASCQRELALLTQLDQALLPPAAPAHLVERVFLLTSRKRSFWGTWRKILATATVGVILGIVGLDVWYHSQQPQAFEQQELVAYMQANAEDPYEQFAADLSAFEDYF